MLRKIRYTRITNFLVVLLGLYLLNISVDTMDRHPEGVPEDLSINDQESLIEIFLEKVLRFEDIVKEYDDHDAEDHNMKKDVKLRFQIFESTAGRAVHLDTDASLVNFPFYLARLMSGYQEIDSPPPKD